MSFEKVISIVSIVLSLVTAGYLIVFNAKSSTAEIEGYIMKNPEVIIKSLEEHGRKNAMQEKENAKQGIVNMQSDIFNSKADPISGPKDASCSIVEFFDYNCGYCKKMHLVKQEVLKNNKDIKFIMKELPILSENSLMKAKAALAVNKIAPEKYEVVNHEFFTSSVQYNTLESIINYIKTLGIQVKAFQDAYNSSEVQDILKVNHNIARSIGLGGTPAHLIGNELVPGLVTQEVLVNGCKKVK